MSVYRTPKSYIDRQLVKMTPAERPRRRLELDIEALLIGPTCGSKAESLAVGVVANGARDVAIAMLKAATRYLASEQENEQEKKP